MERTRNKFADSLRFGGYVLVKPFKGFYELKYEKRGTLAAGLVFMLLYYISAVIRALYTGYTFNPSKGSPVNLGMIFLQSVMPFALLCISTWCLTLMLDGEGRMDQIFMGLCYAVPPLIAGNLLYTVLSNMLTAEEGMYMQVIYSAALLWTGFLVFVSIMEINQYSFGRTILSCILAIIGIAIILLIFLLCFGLIQQILIFIQSVYKELSYR